MKKIVALVPLLLVLAAVPAQAEVVHAGYTKNASASTNQVIITIPNVDCSQSDTGYILASTSITYGSTIEMEQIGMTGSCSGTTDVYGMFYENWPTHLPVGVTPFAITHGDRVKFTVDILNNGNVKYTYNNLTTGAGPTSYTTNVNRRAGDRNWWGETSPGATSEVPPFTSIDFEKSTGFANPESSFWGGPLNLGNINGCGGTCQTFWVRDNR